jgi:hypothetical protein
MSLISALVQNGFKPLQARLISDAITGGFTTAYIIIQSLAASTKAILIKLHASQTANAIEVQNSASTVLFSVKASGVLNLPSYTVATLPAGTNNDRAFVTNALAPVFGVAVVGGGAVRFPVYFDGACTVG